MDSVPTQRAAADAELVLELDGAMEIKLSVRLVRLACFRSKSVWYSPPSQLPNSDNIHTRRSDRTMRPCIICSVSVQAFRFWVLSCRASSLG